MGAGEKALGILGCGWLGFPLGKRLLQEGYVVKGSTTSPDKFGSLGTAGIDPFLVEVLPTEINGDINAFLEGLETLIVDFPPGIRNQPASTYINAVEGLLGELRRSSVKKLLFVSSISVYEDLETFPLYTELESPNASSDRGKALWVVEELLRTEESFKTTVLRLGGLIGPERHPVTSLAGRKGIANGEAPVNLIHQEDCIGIILEVLKKDSFGEIYNAVYPHHPSKAQYYRQMARLQGLEVPEFKNGNSKGKIIGSCRVEKLLEYQFTRNILK